MLELITGPMTGQQYLDSLQDGREVYIYGERVKDVVTHRAFRNAARSIARLYDALHDPKHKDALLATDRQGILTHKFFKPSYSAQELLEAREAIATWARFSYGFMGRTPDYKASFMAGSIRRGRNSSAAHPTKPQHTVHLTNRCLAGSMRTMPCWSSTTRLSRGRTCWCTATSRRPPASTPPRDS